jgi:hypothetical protein
MVTATFRFYEELNISNGLAQGNSLPVRTGGDRKRMIEAGVPHTR